MSADPVSAVALTALLLGAAMAATRYGGVLVQLAGRCEVGGRCGSTTVFVADYAARYGPLLVFLGVLPVVEARLLQHRAALPIALLGWALAAAVLIVTMLIALVAG